jgi:hypothetical protein
VIHRCENCDSKLCLWVAVPSGFVKLWPLFGKAASACWGRRVDSTRGRTKGKALAAILFTKAGWDKSVRESQ